jgi:thioredoxin
MNLNQFKAQLDSRSKPVVVELWAPWCGPCLATKPILEALADEYEGRVDFWAINADEHPGLMSQLGIFGIPTLLVALDGEIRHTHAGAQSRESYRRMFEALSRDARAIDFSMSSFDRFIRLFAASLIAGAGLETGNWFLLIMGGLLAFLGIYDRCPVWRAIRIYFTSRAP